jgi:hypothetical protein
VNWDEISAISTAVQAVVVIVAAAFALWQLREALTARQMAGFLRLMDELENGTVQYTRRFLVTFHEDLVGIAESGDLRKLDRFISGKTRRWEHSLSLGQVRDDLTKLEYAAMLCLDGMLPIRLERTYFTTVVALTWPYLKPIALMLRQVRGVQYLQHFEALYGLYTSGVIYRRRYSRARKRETRRMVMVSKSVVVRKTGV